jgi:hypothetical protein
MTMAITTRFGSEVELLSHVNADGWIKVKRLSDGAEREYHVAELRADRLKNCGSYSHKEGPNETDAIV